MKVVSLFAGIGGFEIGLAKSGHETTIASEIAVPAIEVLRAKFPHVQNVGDVRTLVDLPASTELLTAGFPCQDLSQAGPAVGLTGSRSSLVEEVFRLAARRKPEWILLENVPFMLQLKGGAAMRTIVERLESLGYRWAWRVVDAFGFGLPQRRARVFVLASLHADPADVLLVDDAPLARPETAIGRIAHGFYWTEGRGGLGWAPNAVPTLKNGSSIGIPSPPAILFPDGWIMKPDIRDAERLQGFPSGWTKAAENVGRPASRWSLIGNSVSVPVVTWLGRRLAKPGSYDFARDRSLAKTARLPYAARFDGKRRYSVEIGPDPVGISPPPLTKFLKYEGSPLSERATAGFLLRTETASLRFAPGFIEAVTAHLEAVSA